MLYPRYFCDGLTLNFSCWTIFFSFKFQFRIVTVEYVSVNIFMMTQIRYSQNHLKKYRFFLYLLVLCHVALFYRSSKFILPHHHTTNCYIDKLVSATIDFRSFELANCDCKNTYVNASKIKSELLNYEPKV